MGTVGPTYLDLSGISSLQSQYLKNLQTLAEKDPTKAADIAAATTALSGSLTDLNAKYSAANSNTNDILTKQAGVSNIINAEKDRLLQKKKSIDQALDGQKRLLSLNDSYRLKYAEYMKMILIVIFVLIIWVILNKLSAIGFLPDAFYTLLLIVNITIGLFLCYFIYLDISQRNNMNFNEINVAAPKKLTPDELRKRQEDAAKSGNLLGTINFSGCIGAECCSDGTLWDPGNSVCYGNTLTSGKSTTFVQPFTTLTMTYNVNKPKIKVSANSPNEYEDYLKV
jgi:hypothetical protein